MGKLKTALSSLIISVTLIVSLFMTDKTIAQELTEKEKLAYYWACDDSFFVNTKVYIPGMKDYTLWSAQAPADNAAQYFKEGIKKIYELMEEKCKKLIDIAYNASVDMTEKQKTVYLSCVFNNVALEVSVPSGYILYYVEGTPERVAEYFFLKMESDYLIKV